jgi:hypothetical protein
LSLDPHPISPKRDAALEQRLHLLEERMAQLWDEVWWHQLPPYRRWYYWLRGFRSPIERFYND